MHILLALQGLAFVFTETMVRVMLTPCGRDLCPCVEITFLDSNTVGHRLWIVKFGYGTDD